MSVLGDALTGWPAWLAGTFTVLVLLSGGILVAFVFDRLVVSWARRATAKTKTDLDDLILRAIHPALAILVVWGAMHFGLSTVAEDLPPGVLDGWQRLVLAFGILVFAVLAARVLGGTLRYWGRRRERWQPATRLGGRVGNALVYIVAFLVVLDSYGISITPIITSVGLAGLAVALALQDTLANVFSGIWIQTQRSVDPGHYVRLEGENLEGFVEEVGWRTTKLRTLPGNLVVIPNQTVAKAIVTDYWLPQPKMGTSITLVTAYDTDPDRVVPILLEEAIAAGKEVPFVLAEPTPSARLNKPVAHGWEFWLGFWTPHYYDQWNAQGYVLNRIRRRFAQEGIRMALPITEIVMTERPQGDVPASTSFAVGDGRKEAGTILLRRLG